MQNTTGRSGTWARKIIVIDHADLRCQIVVTIHVNGWSHMSRGEGPICRSARVLERYVRHVAATKPGVTINTFYKAASYNTAS